MKKLALIFVVFISSLSFAGVTITSPANGSGSGSPVHVTAAAYPASGRVISSMIVYLDNVVNYTKYSNSVDTYLSMGAGWHTILIKSWDNYGGIYQSSVAVNVGGQASTAPTTQTTGTNFWNIDQMGGWQSCDTCAGAGGAGPTAAHGLAQNVSSPSIDGHAAQFWLGGSTPYSDALWWKKLVTETQVGTNRAIHHFVYDLYFYNNNPGAAQSLEWDINQFVDGRSYIFGNQCSYRSSGTWDIWDNPNNRWVSTGIACPKLVAYQWSHIVIEAERTGDNKLHYISLTINGVKHYLNWYNSPRGTSWSGITVNYQMDGNYRQDDYSTWVDKFNLTSW
ncbi:MAG: hypothetical protein JWO13_2501 [Acidobacteriales bacterium]|nr:hypothetical protein [Terriglobales bacterium]